MLRPPEPETGGRPIAPVLVAVIERGIRMVLIVAGAAFLAHVWGIDVSMMTAGDSMTNRLLRGGINAAVIILAADFGWSIIKAVMARRLGRSAGAGAAGHAQQDPRQARLRTLLPIFQNMLFATIVVMTLLMVLSSLGVEIGPLIAGAGVVGVAIGFGAQTLVKDVIGGIFYLLDDAFRVGEYIQSGTYKGTVESFSLRSVKLRHHRGYLFTVPFGELGAVQNMSRDWVIDKFSINVDYQTDIEQARKIIKKIGQQLAEDPEYAPHVIEPHEDAGRPEFRRFRHRAASQDDDQARRAIRHPPQGLRGHQEGVRGGRHQDTVPDGDGQGRRVGGGGRRASADATRQGRRGESGSGRSLTGQPGSGGRANRLRASRTRFRAFAPSPRWPRMQPRRQRR